MNRIFCFILLLVCTTAAAEVKVFTPLLDEDGESLGDTSRIIHDKYGFLWVSGSMALKRFDGYQFDRVPGLIDQLTLYIDSKNRLWASGLYSLIQIDLSTYELNVFDTLWNHDHENKKIAVYDARETKQGTMLFGTTYGISKYDDTTKNLKNFDVQAQVGDELKGTAVSSIEFLDADTILIGTEYGAFTFPLINLLENTTGSLQLTDRIGNHELIRKIVKINSEEYLFTKNNGFTYINFAEQKEIHYQNVEGSKVLSDDLVLAVEVIDDEHILIGTNLGLDIFDLKTLAVRPGNEIFRFEELEAPVKISSISLHEGTLYVGTPTSIYTTPLVSGTSSVQTENTVPTLRRAQQKPASTLNTVWSLGSDEAGRLLVGTHGLGAFSIDPSGSWEHYRAKTGELHSDNVSTFLIDNLGDLWVGMVGGVSSNKNEQKKLKPIDFSAEIPKHGDYNVRTIRQAEDSTIWVLSMDWLAQFEMSMELIRVYDFHSPSDIECKSYASTFVNLEEIILVGCENGLVIIDAKENKLIKRHETRKTVTSILKDSHQNVWVLAATQLYHFQEKTLSLEPVGPPDFLPSVSDTGFYNMIEDQYSQIWIAYHGGILVFDPMERKFLGNFGKGTSFEKQQIMFSQDSLHRTKNGDVLVGDVSGLFSFRPVKIPMPTPPNIVVSKISKTFNDESEENIDSKDLSLVSVTASPDTELVFGHTLEKIAFQFTDLDLIGEEQSLYQYYLEGAENDWSAPAEERSVSYLGLKPGDYKLHLKSLKNLQYSDELVFPFTISPHPLLSTAAKLSYVILTALLIFLLSKWRSISLQKRVDMLEVHVNQRTKELSNRNQDIEKLLSERELMVENVFHQTRTPIQLLISNMDELKLGKIPISDYVEKQSNNIQNLIDLTDRILAGVHKSDATLHYQEINLLLSQYAERYSVIAEKKGLVFKYSSDNNLRLTTNTVLLGEAIDNLLSNSVKYTTQGYISFSAGIKGETFSIIVEDSGEGISEKDMAHVLSRGYRSNVSRDKLGNGIGLAIVKENVTHLGGTISIDSKVNEGSIFSLEFPVDNKIQDSNPNTLTTENDGQEDLSSNTNPIFSDPEKKQVLLIEDNIELADYYVKVLESEYSVKLVHSGEKAVEVAIREVPNIVVSDVMMGDFNGFNVVAALRKNPMTRHIPMILLTAKADRRSKIQGFDVGANDYIVKPVQSHELSLRVRNQLNLVRYVEKYTRLEELEEGLDYSDEIASKFLKLVNSRYAEADLSSENIANSLNITKKQLERKIKQVLGSTPKQFLNEFRLDKARLRLSRGEKASTVFELCGFSSHTYFSKKFKEKYGYTPSGYSSFGFTEGVKNSVSGEAH